MPFLFVLVSLVAALLTLDLMTAPRC